MRKRLRNTKQGRYTHWWVYPYEIRESVPTEIIGWGCVDILDLDWAILIGSQSLTRRHAQQMDTSNNNPSSPEAPGLPPALLAWVWIQCQGINVPGCIYPPFSHIAHGSLPLSFAVAVSDPRSFSNPQKKRVVFWVRWTGMFPAKLLPGSNFTNGKLSVTWKSERDCSLMKSNGNNWGVAHIFAIQGWNPLVVAQDNHGESYSECRIPGRELSLG